MHDVSKVAALCLLSAALAGCGATSGSTVPALPQNPLAPQSQPLTRAGNYDFYISGPSGAVERAHIMKVRGAELALSASNLRWNGGPIQRHPKVYLIFWGWSGPSDRTHDPDGEAPYLVSYMDGLGGVRDSGWLNTVTQYYGPRGVFVGATASPIAGAWYDAITPLPNQMSSSAIASEALRAAGHFGYNASAAYIVATPHGHNTPGFGRNFCAWHSATSSPSGPVAYTNLPYMPDAGFSCGEGSVNRPGTLDGVSIVGGHELAETQTDPLPASGWIDLTGGEIGDKCAWMNLQDYRFSSGSFPIQPLWDNRIGRCAISGP